MIGVFDSGMGGLVTLGYLQQSLPNQDFMYLGDTAYLPYGEKSAEFLHNRTFACLERMFDHGCKIVVLACNTASAHAIRDRQSTNPERKVLSITIPGVEEIVRGGYKNPLLLATTSTVNSGIYTNVLHSCQGYETKGFAGISGHGLVSLIESGASEQEIIDLLINLNIQQYKPDCIVLGCTHYPLIQELIRKVAGDIPLIDPSLEASKKMPDYLSRHPEINIDLEKKTPAHIRYCVTGEGYGYNEEFVSIPGEYQ